MILDQAENLVYANKTTKKILSCESKSDIIDALKRIVVKDLDAADVMQEDNFFDNGTKSYRTVRTVRSANVKKHENSAGGAATSNVD